MEKENIYKIKVNTWEELVSSLQGFACFPNYIYRGQANSDWLLESTLSRVTKKIENKNKEELVEEHLRRFKLSIRGRRGINPTKLEENELWALGQHYGLHTPLLDWSQSPYVALFFALTDLTTPKSGYRSLWALHSTDLDKINKWYESEKKNDSQIELINPLIDENNRLVNQNGLFTKIDLQNDIEKWVTESEAEIKWITLQKIDFSDKIRDEALLYLDCMNINYSSLFPDLFGSSMDSNIKLEQTDFIEIQQKKELEKNKS
jgi:hypothetical protein